MKPASFEYHAAATADEALSLLHELGDDVKPLAGGQSLVPMLAMRLTRFAHLVDLNRAPDLRYVERHDGHVRVGAMTRQAVVGRDDEVATAVPLLARAVPYVGHFQIRNRGTVGGSIAHADAAAELPAVALTLDATMSVRGLHGTRTVAAADFFRSLWTVDVEPDELLVEVSFPATGPGWGYAIEEITRRHGDFAMVGVTCAVRARQGVVEHAAVTMFGVDSIPLRRPEAEAALVGRDLDDLDLRDVSRLAVEGLDPPSDVHASSWYRREAGAELVARALATALEEACHD